MDVNVEESESTFEMYDGKLVFDMVDARKWARRSGLRSRKSRHVQKRFKNIIHVALEAYIEEKKK